MIRTLLVGYDLKEPGRDYAELAALLKGFGTWWHHLDSTWLVKTDRSPVELRDSVKALLGAVDEVLVIDVTNQSAAWSGFSERGSHWLRQNI